MAAAQNQDRPTETANAQGAAPEPTNPAAAGPGSVATPPDSAAPSVTGRAAAAPAARAGRNVVKVDAARAAIKQVKVVDTDLVLVTEDGRTIYVRDGAVQAMVDQGFAVEFADGVQAGGQDLLHEAGSVPLSRIEITGTTGSDALASGVVTETPVASPPAAAPERHAPKWQNYALIGAPIIGGGVAGVLAKGSGGSSTTTNTTQSGSSGTTQVATKTTMPVISPINGNSLINKAQKDAGVTVSGTAEANATVTVLFGSAQQTATASASGAWSVTFTKDQVPADAAQVSISATAKSSTASTSDPATRDVRIDTAGPAAPTFDAVTGDNVLSPTEQQGPITVSGSAESGATIRVQWGSTTKNVVTDPAGSWSATFAKGEYPAQPGDTSITATATDSASNPGSPATLPVTISPQIDVTGFVAAGKLLSGNGLVVSIYTGDGKTLLAGPIKVSANGSFSATGLSVANGAPVIAVVTDTNEAADYLDEATNASKSLGSVRLLSTGIVTGASISLNVNPLTSIAAQLAGLAEDGSGSVTAAKVTAANLQVAQAMGLGATDITQLTPVLTNGGAFNSKDGLTTGEKVGALLAALSGTDAINGGNPQQTITDLAAQIANGKLSTAGQSQVMAGAIKAAPLVDPTLQSVVSDVVAQSAPASQFTIDPVTGDNIISAADAARVADKSLLIGGTVAAGASAVRLQFGSRAAAATVTGTTWSYAVTADDLVALGSNGVKVLTAEATLADGSTTTSSRPVSLFTTTPITPNLVSLLVTGSTQALPASTGFTINASAAGSGFVLSGTGQAGSKLTVSWASGTPDQTVTVGSDGKWSVAYTPSQVPQTVANKVTITASDQFGNTSTPVVVSTQFDNVAPPAPTINDVGRVGISAATNGVVLSGTGEPGATVTVNWGKFTSTGQVVVGANKVWSLSVPGASLPDNGLQVLRVSQTDAAGNTSPEVAQSVTVAATPPPAPSAITLFAADNFVNATEATSTYQIRGKATPGQTVFVNFGEVTLRSSVVGSTGDFTINASSTAPVDGTYTVTAYAVDADGNRSATYTYPTQVVVDTAIGKPAITALGDGFTINQAAARNGAVITGTADLDVTRLTLSLTNGTTTISAVGRLDGKGGWTAVLPAPADGQAFSLADGTRWRATATASDRAGNTATSDVRSFTVDTTPPTTLTMNDVNGTNTIGKDALQSGVFLSGTGEPGAKVSIAIKLGGTTIYNTAEKDAPIVVAADGSWRFTLAAAAVPADNNYTFTVTQTDPAGNVGTGLDKPVTIKTGGLVAPTDILVAADNYINAGEFFRDITVSGKAPVSAAGQTVTVTWNSPSGTQGALTASPVKVGADGSWSTSFAANSIPGLNNGTFKVYARLSDQANNTSADAVQSVTVDTLINTPLLVTPIVANNVFNISALTNTVNVQVRGDNDFARVRFTVGGVQIDGVRDPSLNLFTASFQNVKDAVVDADGTISVSAEAFDAAGNTKTSTITKVLADFVAPDLPVFAPAQGYINKAMVDPLGTITYTGTAERGASLDIRLVDGGKTYVPDTPVTADSRTGTWTATFSGTNRPGGGAVSRSLTLTATATDTAGNQGATATLPVTLDSLIVPPVTTGIFTKAGAASAFINAAMRDAGFTIRGTTEAGNAIKVNVGGRDFDAVVDDTGAWVASVPAGTTLAESTAATITVTASDPAGNSAQTTRTSVPIDFTVTAPSIAQINGGSFSTAAATTWINADAVKTAVTISGKTDPGARVQVDAVNASGTRSGLGLSAQADASGNWTLSTTNLARIADGTYTLSATATDAYGNTASSTGTAPGFALDRTVPSSPVIDPVTGDNNISAVELAAAVRLSGSVEPGTTPSLVWGSYTPDNITYDPATGKWSVDVLPSSVPVPTTADRIVNLVVKATDTAGNVTQTSVPVTISSVTPGNPAFEAFIAGDNVINADERKSDLVINGAINGLANKIEVTLHRDADGANTTRDKVAAVNATGSSWTATFRATDLLTLGDGSYTVTAKSTLGDQVRTVTRAVSVITTAPPPVLTGIAHVLSVNGKSSYFIARPDQTGGFNVTGTANPGDQVTVTLLRQSDSTVVRTQTSDVVPNSGEFSVNIAPGFLTGLVDKAVYTVRALVRSKEGNTSIITSQDVTADFTKPQVVSFLGNVSSGTFGTGKQINITATMSTAVKAGETLKITLNTGQQVTLTAPADGLTMTGVYTVASGQTATKLAVKSIDSVGVRSTIDNVLDSTSLDGVANFPSSSIVISANPNENLQDVSLLGTAATITGVATTSSAGATALTSNPAVRFQIPSMGGRKFQADEEITVVIAEGPRKGEIVASYKVPATALNASGNWTADPTLVLTASKVLVPGTYKLAVQVLDDFGNASSLDLFQKPLTLTIDGMAPEIDLNGAAQAGNDVVIPATFTADATSVALVPAATVIDRLDSASSTLGQISAVRIQVNQLAGGALTELLAVEGATAGTAQWNADGTTAGTPRFTLAGQSWQVAYDAASKTFTLTAVDTITSSATPQLTDVSKVQALITALRYADPNGAAAREGGRAFTFTVVDAARNVSAPAVATVVVDSGRPAGAAPASYALDTNGDGLRDNQYQIGFTEAVRVAAVVNPLNWTVALTDSTPTTLDKLATIAPIDPVTINGVVYASRFLITMIPGQILSDGKVVTDAGTLSIAAESVVGSGGNSDTAGGPISFIIPSSAYDRRDAVGFTSPQPLRTGFGGTATPEFPESGLGFISAARKSFSYNLISVINAPKDSFIRFAINGVEVNNKAYPGQGGFLAPGPQINFGGLTWGADGVKQIAYRLQDAGGNLSSWMVDRKIMVDSSVQGIKAVSQGAADNTVQVTFGEAVTLSAGSLSAAFGTGASATAVGGYSLALGAGLVNSNGSVTQVGVARAQSGPYAQTWTITLGTNPTLTAGTAVTLTGVRDVAGNTSDLGFTLPNAPTSQPGTPVIQTVSDDNVIDSTNISANQAVTVALTGARADDVVRLYRDGVLVGTTTVGTSGVASVSFQVAPTTWGADGEHALTASIQRGSGSEVFSAFKSVYVSAQTTHWSQLYANTQWFDPDSLIAQGEGAAVSTWTASVGKPAGSSAMTVAQLNFGSTPVLSRDSAGHLQLSFVNSVMTTDFVTMGSLKTGMATFTVAKQLAAGGATLIGSVVAPDARGSGTSAAPAMIYSMGSTMGGDVYTRTEFSSADAIVVNSIQPVTGTRSTPGLWRTQALVTDGTTIDVLIDGAPEGGRPVTLYNNSGVTVPANSGARLASNSATLQFGSNSSSGVGYQGLIGDQIMIPTAVTAAVTGEINAYIAAKYQTVGSPVAVTSEAATYDLTAAPLVGYPAVLDQILQLGQSLLGTKNDTVITAGPDFVNTGAGRDTVRTTDLRFRVLDGGVGFDTLALDRGYSNAASGNLFNLSDYVSNARGIADKFGSAADDARVNANGFHALRGFEKLDLSRATDSQTVRLTLADIDQLADKNVAGDPNALAGRANLYLQLGSNDVLDRSGLTGATLERGFWTDADGAIYTRRFVGNNEGDQVALYVRGGVEGADYSAGLGAISRSATSVTLGLDQPNATLGDGSGWSVLAGSTGTGTVTGSSLSADGQTLTLTGTGLGGSGTLELGYARPASGGLANANGDGPVWTNVAIGTSGDDTINLSGRNLGSGYAIFGLDGNDTITGTGFADLIVTGTGNDVMTGGRGPDVFRVAQNDTGRDVITDFDLSQGDIIDLRSLLGNTGLKPTYGSDGAVTAINGLKLVTQGLNAGEVMLTVDSGSTGATNASSIPYSLVLQNVSVGTNGTEVTIGGKTLAELINQQTVLIG